MQSRIEIEKEIQQLREELNCLNSQKEDYDKTKLLEVSQKLDVICVYIQSELKKISGECDNNSDSMNET